MKNANDTDIQEVVLAESNDPKVCTVHRAVVVVLTGLSQRVRRIEAVGICILALTGGIFGKDLIMPLIMKIIAGG